MFSEGPVSLQEKQNKNKGKKDPFENSCNICASWVMDKYSYLGLSSRIRKIKERVDLIGFSGGGVPPAPDSIQPFPAVDN